MTIHLQNDAYLSFVNDLRRTKIVSFFLSIFLLFIHSFFHSYFHSFFLPFFIFPSYVFRFVLLLCYYLFYTHTHTHTHLHTMTQNDSFFAFSPFLDATRHLFKRACLSVRPSARWSVGQSRVIFKRQKTSCPVSR